MDSQEFRVRGTEMVEYICKYMETLNQRRVTPSVEPGYLRHLLPGEAPQNPENWDDIMRDVETKIMPGVTHWQHPRFHAYFPAGNSYPSILGDMLSDGIGCIGFSWVIFIEARLFQIHSENVFRFVIFDIFLFVYVLVFFKFKHIFPVKLSI